VDSRWARVGSSNLNMASWMGNWELDIAVENPGFAQEMERMYLEDLENTTEIMLSEKNKVRPLATPEPPPGNNGSGHRRRGSASRLTAGAIRVGNTVGAAITSKLVLGAAEAKIMLFGGSALLGLSVLALLAPLIIVIPFVLIFGWIGLSLLIKAYHLHHSPPHETNFQNRNGAGRADEAQLPPKEQSRMEEDEGVSEPMQQQETEPEVRKAAGGM
jgi:cardiolipin synthase A/B